MNLLCMSNSVVVGESEDVTAELRVAEQLSHQCEAHESFEHGHVRGGVHTCTHDRHAKTTTTTTERNIEGVTSTSHSEQ